MADHKIIFTNKALTSIKGWGLSEAEVLDTFNQGETERSSKFDGWNAVKKYPGREIWVSYARKNTRQSVIINAWERTRP